MYSYDQKLEDRMASIDRELSSSEPEPMDDRSIMFVRQSCSKHGLNITYKEAETAWLKITKAMGLKKLPVGVLTTNGITSMVRAMR